MQTPKTTPRKKILIVTGVLWIGGGAEKVAANLGNYLTDVGYETHLLTFYEAPEKYPYHGIYHSFDETPKSKLQKIFRIPQRIYKIARYAKVHDIDLAYAFLEEANFYTLLAKLIFRRRLSVVVSVRNNIRQRGWLFRTLSKLLYPYAKAVVSVTKVVEQMLKDDFKLKNTTTIYNSLDMELIARKQAEPLSQKYQWLTERSPLLISIGRLIGQKGQWHLIRAFSAVHKAYPEATLVILGEGEYRAQLETLIADCSLSDNVTLLGKHSNVYQFLAAADLFVFSSRFEGMPNTMLEAFSVGLPIISTDCPSGPREIIAPELPLSTTPQYPYTSSYGVLVKPFTIDAAPVWNSPSKVPLSEQEQQLADVVCATLNSGWRRGEVYTAYKERIETTFDYQQIMKQWEVFIERE